MRPVVPAAVVGSAVWMRRLDWLPACRWSLAVSRPGATRLSAVATAGWHLFAKCLSVGLAPPLSRSWPSCVFGLSSGSASRQRYAQTTSSTTTTASRSTYWRGRVLPRLGLGPATPSPACILTITVIVLSTWPYGAKPEQPSSRSKSSPLDLAADDGLDSPSFTPLPQSWPRPRIKLLLLI
jgi:hypothetical protein